MPSDPRNWADLRTAIAAWLVRDDQEVMIPAYIAMAERRFDRTIFTPDREILVTLAAADTVALPADFQGAKTVCVDADPRIVLEPMPLGVLRGRYAAAYTARPVHYAISGASMILGPAPDSAYPIELTYWQDIPALGEDRPDNWLLLAHSDLYIAGALTEAYLVLRDPEAATLWEARTAAKIEEINRAGQRYAFSGPPQRIRSATIV